MKNSKLNFLFIFALSLFFMACQDEEKTKDQLVPQKNTKVNVPAFDTEAAYNFIDKQVSFGPRVPNSEGHKKCKAWLVSTFKSFGAEVIEQDFTANAYTGTVLNGTNIIARYNPKVQERIILAAHWDTRHIADQDPDSTRYNEPIMGADDGGSGVGVLLSIAKTLKNNPIPMGIDFILFDAEDHGDDDNTVDTGPTWCLGAQHWAKNLHLKRTDVKYGILLDMVGAKNAVFPKEGVSLHFAKPIVDKVWKLGQQMGKGKYFIEGESDPAFITDDHLFVNKFAQIPMIDIIHRKNRDKFGDHWHTHNDNMDIIDKNTLAAVGQVVTAVVYKESNKEF